MHGDDSEESARRRWQGDGGAGEPGVLQRKGRGNGIERHEVNPMVVEMSPGDQRRRWNARRKELSPMIEKLRLR